MQLLSSKRANRRAEVTQAQTHGAHSQRALWRLRAAQQPARSRASGCTACQRRVAVRTWRCRDLGARLAGVRAARARSTSAAPRAPCLTLRRARAASQRPRHARVWSRRSGGERSGSAIRRWGHRRFHESRVLLCHLAARPPSQLCSSPFLRARLLFTSAARHASSVQPWCCLRRHSPPLCHSGAANNVRACSCVPCGPIAAPQWLPACRRPSLCRPPCAHRTAVWRPAEHQQGQPLCARGTAANRAASRARACWRA